MIKSLFLSAQPNNTQQLDINKEMQEIVTKIHTSNYGTEIKLEYERAVRPDDLLQAMNVHHPHIVHFSGHGNKHGELLLIDTFGDAKPVSAVALKALFTAVKGNIKIVILNSCFSDMQAKAIAEVIDCVIGMNGEISDIAAITFIASFYRGIGFGYSILNAFDQGKVALLLEGISEEHIPVIYHKEGVDPAITTLVSPSLGELLGNNSTYNLQNSNLKYTPQSGSVAQVELKITRDFKDYSEIEQNELLVAIKHLLQVGNEVKIIQLRPGSVLLTIELPKDKVALLSNLVKAGVLAKLSVTDAKVLTTEEQEQSIEISAMLAVNLKVKRPLTVSKATGTKLYVGNLAYSTTEEEIANLFANAGTVISAIVMVDRETGRSKGFGFVEMSTTEEAAKAISLINGTNFQSRVLTVNPARPGKAKGY